MHKNCLVGSSGNFASMNLKFVAQMCFFFFFPDSNENEKVRLMHMPYIFARHINICLDSGSVCAEIPRYKKQTANVK